MFATLEPMALIAAKVAADPAGHYSRPDVTRLMLNRSTNPCVVDFNVPLQPTVGLASDADLNPATDLEV